MSPEELNWLATPRFAAPPGGEPPADLWPRIAQAHSARCTRRRRRRVAGAAAITLVAVMVSLTILQAPPVNGTDWQARAQALELELRVATAARGAENPAAQETESELVQVDGALQAAYDRGAEKNELVPLWKQRSELLTTLLATRRQSLAVTRI